MNYYPFHIGDYAKATQHLTLEEDGMYRRLLDLCYITEKPLPKDHRQLYRLTRAMTDLHREAVITVLHEFFTETDDGWVSVRANVEIEAMREKQQKQRDKANKRWHMPVEERGNASAMPQHTESDAVASKHDANAMPPTPTPTPKVINTSAAVAATPDGVSVLVWRDFVQLRKDKKSKLTQTALDGIASEARKAGWELEAALRECCSRGWVGFKAEWVAPGKQKPESYRERDERLAANRMAEFAPGVARKAADFDSNIIDLGVPYVAAIAGR